MANDWFPVLTGLIGAGVGAVLGIGADLVNSSRANRMAVEAWTQETTQEHVRWRRERAVDAIEDALTAVSALHTADHPDHETWLLQLASCNLRIRLYCGSEVQGAFSAIRNSAVKVAQHPAHADEKVMLLLGEATKYLQITARFDLGIEGTQEDVETAQATFLSAVGSMRDERRA